MNRMTVDELLDVLMRQDRNSGPATLEEWWDGGVIGEDELRGVILHVWGMAEFPAQYVSSEVWQEWFDITGFVSDERSERPTSPITVWRGALLEHGPAGFSWTTERETAQWFAEREAQLFRRGPAGVWRMSARPGSVLAVHYARADEQEVIIDPDSVLPGDALLVQTLRVTESFGALPGHDQTGETPETA